MGYFKVIISLYTFINIGILSSTTLGSISLFKYSVTDFSTIFIVRKNVVMYLMVYILSSAAWVVTPGLWLAIHVNLIKIFSTSMAQFFSTTRYISLRDLSTRCFDKQNGYYRVVRIAYIKH